MAPSKHIHLPPATVTAPPTTTTTAPPKSLPKATTYKTHPSSVLSENNAKNATLTFIGTATTILEWQGIRILTDPNFLHAGDHVHLGPGVTAERITNPAIELEQLPGVSAVLLSHYHADHFDQKVESELRRDLPIITTPHAHHYLSTKPGNEKFTNVHPLDTYESLYLDVDQPATKEPGRKEAIRIIAMPGKHVPPGPGGVFEKVNDLLGAVPPVNGWVLELGSYKVRPAGTEATDEEESWKSGYRIYITGDTLLIDELAEIPKRFTDAGKRIDLMLVHLGGTTIPGTEMVPRKVQIMVTMDAEMGVRLVGAVRPEVTVPIHFDDYDVFKSPLDDFKKEMEKAGWNDKVVYLDRGEAFRFGVPE
ncbi:Metallo-hydrolase/oxidoreductase [Ascobolus immersus RN42]|uniref:Metallo-hydrolase/oxidoreductase n=1 Tax=Ascobolus immersus RN42 TaxID=1160509 RepID=A0A3N4HQ84_ASCIM|nr:Metallo-hydrolase/oxidoreductase [Ascobolus immersus RN42]